MTNFGEYSIKKLIAIQNYNQNNKTNEKDNRSTITCPYIKGMSDQICMNLKKKVIESHTNFTIYIIRTFSTYRPQINLDSTEEITNITFFMKRWLKQSKY